MADFFQNATFQGKEWLVVGGIVLVALLGFAGFKIRRMIEKRKKKEVRYIVF